MLTQACPLKGKARTRISLCKAKQRGLKASRWWQDDGLMLSLASSFVNIKGKGVKLNASFAHSKRISALAEVEKDWQNFWRLHEAKFKEVHFGRLFDESMRTLSCPKFKKDLGISPLNLLLLKTSEFNNGMDEFETLEILEIGRWDHTG
ncbi:hypothetical protein Tco_0487337 [Tanacetum coccineum]